MFHYKVDELLKPDDRESYRAVARDPRTTNESARAWLLDRGYTPSLSAVARHRRRLIAADRQHQADLDRVRVFARITGTESMDFAQAAEFKFQQMVFEYLMRLSARDEAAAESDADPDEAAKAAELLRLGKLVAQCVDLATARMGVGPASRRRQSPCRADAAPPVPPPPPGPRDAALVDRIEDILGVRRAPADPAADDRAHS